MYVQVGNHNQLHALFSFIQSSDHNLLFAGLQLCGTLSLALLPLVSPSQVTRLYPSTIAALLTATPPHLSAVMRSLTRLSHGYSSRTYGAVVDLGATRCVTFVVPRQTAMYFGPSLSHSAQSHGLGPIRAIVIKIDNKTVIGDCCCAMECLTFKALKALQLGGFH